MKWVIVLGCLGLVGACTKRNPAYCGDGTCVDPSLPYCDIDGAIGGMPGTCIAVMCTPGELAICKGDAAVTCASSGSNYDTVQCPFGCDPAAGGCKECTSNAQCEDAQVCDEATSHCRGCAADDECDSRVCDLDSGSCVDESAILYAAPGASGTCSLSQPCAPGTAIVEAENATPTPVVRLLPGTYTSPLRLTVPSAVPVSIVGTGATMAVVGDVAAIVVDSGASAHVRDLASTSERQVQCGLGSTSAPFSSIVMERSDLTMIGAGLAFETQRCTVDLKNVDLTTNVDILGTRDDSTFTADGLYVHSSAIPSIIGAGARVTIDVTNAVLEDTQIVGFFNDAGPPGSSMRFSYSTFLLPNVLSLCKGATATYLSVAFENSILATEATRDAFEEPMNPANCMFVSTILARQSTPPTGTTVADPKFVNLATRDFHLQSTSPAVDSATTAKRNPDHDLEGVTRPQGAAPDIGAYELAP